MKITMFNGVPTTLNLRVLAGGFDPTSGKMVLVVTGDNGSAGTIALDVTESRDVNRLLTANAPTVERVDAPVLTEVVKDAASTKG